MKSALVNVSFSPQDRFGRQLAACLDTSAASLPHDITERLRVARQQALSKAREVRATNTAAQHVGGGALAMGRSGDSSPIWPWLVSLVPLFALIAGLVLIQMIGNDQLARELAEIDAAILTDDLPPAAYTDPGFAQFIKARADLKP